MEDTPNHEEVSKEALEKALKAKENLNHDVLVLTLKIDASLAEIRNQMKEISEYLTDIKQRVSQ